MNISTNISPAQKKWLLAFLLFLLIAPARFIGLERFATYDEPWWIISGSNFYYALGQREFENTIYDYHPAVTTTWLVTAGMVGYFPEYRGLGQGYFDVRKPLYENFIREQGRDPLMIIRNSRRVQSALLVMLALLVFFLLQKLVPEEIAFWAAAFGMNAPFFVGNARLINHEGMVAMFSLVCALAMLAYLHEEKKLIYLLISGAAFGLAQLTKSSSIVLLPLIGLMLFVELIQYVKTNFASALWSAVKTFFIWLLAAAFVYVALWPGMWVNPAKMLYEVYGNAFSYAFQGARLDVTGEVQPAALDFSGRFEGIGQYLYWWLSSVTPLTWLGLLLLPFAFLKKNPPSARLVVFYLLLLGALFVILFGVAQGRNALHYILSTFASWDIAAALGWGFALLHLSNGWRMLRRRAVLFSAFGLLLAFQLGSAWAHFPYFYTYGNPLTSTGGVHGYGEGLDLAAQYLAQKPNAADMYVIAYAGRGCFSYFFPGRTEHMRAALNEGQPFVEDIANADYLVVYNIRQSGRPEGAALIHALQNVTPEKIITYDGFEYARIYLISEIPKDVFDVLSRNAP